MIEAIDVQFAACIWNGFDPLSRQHFAYGDKDLFLPLDKKLTRSSLGAMLSGRCAGGYTLKTALGVRQIPVLVPHLELLRETNASGLDGAVEIIAAISELGAVLGPTAIPIEAATTLAFFLRPDLPVVILDTTTAWLHPSDRNHLDAGKLHAWLSSCLEILALASSDPRNHRDVTSHPRTSGNQSQNWHKRRQLHLALRRQGRGQETTTIH